MEGAGAGPPCGLLAAAIPKEAAGAAPPASLQAPGERRRGKPGSSL